MNFIWFFVETYLFISMRSSEQSGGIIQIESEQSKVIWL